MTIVDGVFGLFGFVFIRESINVELLFISLRVSVYFWVFCLTFCSIFILVQLFECLYICTKREAID